MNENIEKKKKLGMKEIIYDAPWVWNPHIPEGRLINQTFW